MLTIFNKEIREVQNIFSSAQSIEYKSSESWPINENEELILKNDMAMDLGGGEAFGISGILFTTEDGLVDRNRIIIEGPNLIECASTAAEKEINYSRFVVVKLKKSAVEEKTSQQLYAIFRKLDYVRYHIFPKGFVLRISAVQHREVVRLSKEAINECISFEKVGNAFISAYLELTEVESVQIYFCTSYVKNDNFSNLDKISRRANEITESLNEIFKGLKMDCSTCGQKELCDEIDGLRELHQKV